MPDELVAAQTGRTKMAVILKLALLGTMPDCGRDGPARSAQTAHQ
jgi:hypothetical protein